METENTQHTYIPREELAAKAKILWDTLKDK